MLAKNPEISDYIIKYCINRNGGSEELAPLDDSLEIKCRRVMLERLFKQK